MELAIIFGACGQTGHYLQKILADQGQRVCGVGRSGGERRVDIRDFSQVEPLIRELRPDRIFHLAANSTTHHAAIFENQATIMDGTIHVLEAAKRHAPEARIFITGSGLQFANDGRPIDEQVSFHASSPYALARISSAYAARYYRSLGLRVYVGYLFNHESPLRPVRHVSQMVARAAVAIAAGRQAALEIGDLTVSKEWTFAGDTAAAISTLVNQDTIQEAVIGSGMPFTIQQWVEACFSCLNKDWRDFVRARDDFRAQYHMLVSDPKTIQQLGWRPKVSFDELASMMVHNAADSAPG